MMHPPSRTETRQDHQQQPDKLCSLGFPDILTPQQRPDTNIFCEYFPPSPETNTNIMHQSQHQSYKLTTLGFAKAEPFPVGGIFVSCLENVTPPQRRNFPSGTTYRPGGNRDISARSHVRLGFRFCCLLTQEVQEVLRHTAVLKHPHRGGPSTPGSILRLPYAPPDALLGLSTWTARSQTVFVMKRPTAGYTCRYPLRR